MLPLQREVAWPCSTHLVPSIALGAAVAVAVAAAGAVLVGPRVIRCHRASKTDVATARVKTYAFEAFPRWVAAHPDCACPRSLAELDAYTAEHDAVDPWGTRYHFACGPRAIPRTAHGIWVTSAGEDGVFGTADDVRSDR